MSRVSDSPQGANPTPVPFPLHRSLIPFGGSRRSRLSSLHISETLDENTVNSWIVRDNFCLAKPEDETEPNRVLSWLSTKSAAIGRKESKLIGFGFLAEYSLVGKTHADADNASSAINWMCYTCVLSGFAWLL